MGVLACYEDYLGSAVRTVSSENTDFPASNLYDQVQRSLTWRSAGYFEVTSANKTIVFEETSSTPLTATIAEASYTSDATFFAAIKAALEAVGASTYTVSRNATTKKIMIASDGGGGGGLFNLLWTDASTTAEDLLGFDNADDTGALSYTADDIRIHTSEWLKWDLGASSNPDAFIAVGRASTGVNVSPTATITLEGNATDNWSSPAYQQVLTYDELALLKLKAAGDDGLHTTALRYWRLTVVDKANANGYVELASLFLGEYYSPTTGQPTFPFGQSTVDNSTVSSTSKGAFYATSNERVSSFAINWANLTTTEKERFDIIYRLNGRAKPFFVVFDSTTLFSSDARYLTKYVRFSSEITTSLDRPNLWSSGWQLAEEV